MAKPTYFTICSRNYLAYALTLGRSLRKADPNAEFVIFLADERPDPTATPDIEFELVPASELPLPYFSDMAVRYSIMEFNTAIKPACFKYLLGERGHVGAVYLDPDIYVLRPLDHVETALREGANLVLTPHALSPLDDGEDPDDLRILRTGTYNLGFAAFSRSKHSLAFLDWWDARLAKDCRVALDDGLFVDQKWMDLAPSYVSDTTILRHPGYNAAYWNLYGRPIEISDRGWTAAGEPLYFYHFSGVTPGDGTVYSKHQSRYGVEDIGDLTALLHEYLTQLDRNGNSFWSRQPYAYALPHDLKGVDGFVRAAFRRRFTELQAGVEFRPEQLEALCNETCALIRARSGMPITNLTYEIWAQRMDLRRAFDLSQAEGREQFNLWLLTSGVSEHAIPTRLVAHLRSATKTQPTMARNSLVSVFLHALLKLRAIAKPIINRLPESWVGASRRWLQALMRRSSNQFVQPNIPAEPPDEDGTPRAALAVYGYFNAESGLGQAVRREFRALRSAGLPALARLINADQFLSRENFEFDFDEGQTAADIHLIHVNADQITNRDTWADPKTFSPHSYKIGFWAWELDRFPDAWKPALRVVDEIWVPSQFVADSVCTVTDKPVHVFAHPVPLNFRSRSQSDARRRFALPDGVPIFLTIFDFNSFIERKNPFAVLEAFKRARIKAPNLRLVIKCHGGQLHDSSRLELFDQLRKVCGVHIIDRVLESDAMDDLYTACDGLISLHRSEGFGLTIAEAMARAKAVIATGYSGNTDFFDEEVGIMIPYTMVDVEANAYPFGQGARWAEPDIDSAANALAALARDPLRRRALGMAGQVKVEAQLSLDAVGRAMAARISEIRAQLGS